MTAVGPVRQSGNANATVLHTGAPTGIAESQRVTPTDDDIAHVHAIVRGAGSSFYGAMRTLPAHQREAMFAIYAFCREIDDIADDPLPIDEKTAALAAWRDEIARLYRDLPGNPISRALFEHILTYGLEKDDFLALIDGMEMDATDALRGPPMATLVLYCERVAGAVGRLSIRVFGADGQHGESLAWSLGQALQLTNILRDLREDAERGRLYLPAELLEKHGIATREPAAVLAHPSLPGVCDELAQIARRRFEETIAAAHHLDRRKVRPAIVMMQVYRRILDKLIERGWRRIDQPVRISKLGKIFIALRYGLF